MGHLHRGAPSPTPNSIAVHSAQLIQVLTDTIWWHPSLHVIQVLHVIYGDTWWHPSLTVAVLLCCEDTKGGLYTLTFTVEAEAANDTLYLAYSFPYTFSDLQHYLQEPQLHSTAPLALSAGAPVA